MYRNLAGFVLAAACGVAIAADEITFTFSGQISNGVGLEVTSPLSAGTLDPAEAYEFFFEPVLAGGTGVFADFGSLVAIAPLPLVEALPLYGDFIDDAPERFFTGSFRNPGGNIPTADNFREINFSGQPSVPFNFSFAYGGRVNADGTVTFKITDADLRSGSTPVGALAFSVNTSGATYPNNSGFNLTPFGGPDLRGTLIPSTRVTVRRVTPPADRGAGAQTEWKFDGSLNAAAGPAKLQYLDFEGFFEQSDETPDVYGAPFLQTPLDAVAAGADAEVGLTQSLGAFGNTATFGLPEIDGAPASVWKIPATDRGGLNGRGIGLVLYPATAADYGQTVYQTDPYPGYGQVERRRVGDFTMIWDVYIPQETWDRGYCFSFFNTSSDNDSHANDTLGAADFLIRKDPQGSSGKYGPGTFIGTDLTNINGKIVRPSDSAGFGPDRWMRIAYVMDDSFGKESFVYVNGVRVARLAYSDYVSNVIDPADPRWYQYNSSFSAQPIDAAVWESWGGVPNPWVDTGNTLGSGRYQTRSQFTLFSDPWGRTGEAFIANMAFAERRMSESEITALGGPKASGILLKASDINGDGAINVQDLLAYLSIFRARDPRADFNKDGSINVQDLLAYLSAFRARA